MGEGINVSPGSRKSTTSGLIDIGRIYNEESGSFSVSLSTSAGASLDEICLYQLDLKMLEYDRIICDCCNY